MNIDSQKNDWESCPAGILSDVKGPGKKPSQSPFGVGIGVGAAACVLFVAVSMLMKPTTKPTTNSATNERPVAISCHEVLTQLAAYRAETLDSALTERITAHLRVCDYCRERVYPLGR